MQEKLREQLPSVTMKWSSKRNLMLFDLRQAPLFLTSHFFVSMRKHPLGNFGRLEAFKYILICLSVVALSGTADGDSIPVRSTNVFKSSSRLPIALSLFQFFFCNSLPLNEEEEICNCYSGIF